MKTSTERLLVGFAMLLLVGLLFYLAGLVILTVLQPMPWQVFTLNPTAWDVTLVIPLLIGVFVSVFYIDRWLY